MSRATDRRAEQDAYERDRIAHERHDPSPDPRTYGPRIDACLGLYRHDYTMRGTDGKLRCWLCCKRKSE